VTVPIRSAAWSKSEDIAGRYATSLRMNRRAPEFQPAANEVAMRDYDAEAASAVAMVKEYAAGPGGRPDTLEYRTDPADESTRLSDPQDENAIRRLAAPAISIVPDPQQAYFMSTQEWDGYVTDIRAEAFDAVITPVAGTDDFRQDTVTVPLWLVDDDARERVKPGALFRLATGRQRRKRQIIHGARIYFRVPVDVRKQEGLDTEALEAFFDD